MLPKLTILQRAVINRDEETGTQKSRELSQNLTRRNWHVQYVYLVYLCLIARLLTLHVYERDLTREGKRPFAWDTCIWSPPRSGTYC